ncbi:presenilin-1 isoform X2 [Tasmannia lanceolata]|uniref:presenilin-1 isoform X2 n=1 Tax=Tasmannia lanceolata TaxID=3420 RepID=UPI00406480B2
METGSILESIGPEIIGVMSPVSICMFLVVLLVYTIPPTSDLTPIRTAATLAYLETPSDSTTQKLEGALLNAAIFVILIALVTFLLLLLYYYNFNNFLKHYMRFSAFFVFASMGGSIFLSIIQRFSIPLDFITSSLLLLNFTIVGVLSVFSAGVPIIVRQSYMVSLGIIVAAWFTKLPEWTTWVLLVALAVYDLVAVLAPGGPLKLLVELASSRDEELPALIYEARPTVSRNSLGLLVAGASETVSVELQPVPRENLNPTNSDHSTIEVEEGETSPLVSNSNSSIREESQSPRVDVPNSGNDRGRAERDGVMEMSARGYMKEKKGFGSYQKAQQITRNLLIQNEIACL